MSHDEQSKIVFDAAQSTAFKRLHDKGDAWLVASATKAKYLDIQDDALATPIKNPAGWARAVAANRCRDMLRAMLAKKRDLALIDGNLIDTQPGLSPFLKKARETPASELLQYVLQKLREIEPNPELQNAFLDYFSPDGSTANTLAASEGIKSLGITGKTLSNQLKSLQGKVLLAVTLSLSPEDLDDWKQLNLPYPSPSQRS